MVMKKEELTLADSLRVLNARDRADLRGHPAAEDLIAYQEGRLSGVEADVVRDHLAICPRCADTVLDLDSFAVDVPLRVGGHQRNSPDEATDWEAIQRRLQGLERVEHGVRFESEGDSRWKATAEPPPEVTPVSGWGRFEFRALAAVLAVTVVGLSWWVNDLRWQLDSAEGEPGVTANVFFHELNPEGVGGKRTTGPGSEVVVPVGMESVLLFLNLDDFRSFDDYEASIFGEGDVLVWRQRGLSRTPEGAFTIALRRSSYPKGTYRIELNGWEGAEKTQLAVYFAILAYP